METAISQTTSKDSGINPHSETYMRAKIKFYTLYSYVMSVAVAIILVIKMM